MISLDTNILLRLIVADDAEQLEIAIGLLQGETYITPTALQETAWVLRSAYQLERPDIAAALLDILDMPNMRTNNEALMRWALLRYGTTNSDLPDLLHLALSNQCQSFATFDRKLAGQAGDDTPVPIQLLA